MKKYPSMHVPEFGRALYIALNGQIYRNTAAPASAPELMHILRIPEAAQNAQKKK